VDSPDHLGDARRKRTADLVALILAITLAVVMVLIMITAIVNVIDHQSPTPTLGENTTQVLTSSIGGVIGILGAYVGYSFRPPRHGPDDDL
jgi:Co/Zn/Cd efflux system component